LVVEKRNRIYIPFVGRTKKKASPTSPGLPKKETGLFRRNQKKLWKRKRREEKICWSTVGISKKREKSREFRLRKKKKKEIVASLPWKNREKGRNVDLGGRGGEGRDLFPTSYMGREGKRKTGTYRPLGAILNKN